MVPLSDTIIPRVEEERKRWAVIYEKKHRTILQAIFKIPVQSKVKWADIEALFVNLGAELSEGSGSRVHVLLNGVKAVFHRPHPRKETDKGALVSLRRFLENAGIKNDEI